MVKTAKMELLRALISECLSVAAQEIFKMIERTIIEYEEEMSCSKWVVDSHRRLLDVAKAHSEDSDVKQPAVGVSVCWEPENTTSEQREHCPTTNNSHPDPPPASLNAPSDQEILVDIEEDDVKQECDPNTPLKTLKVNKPFTCPVCLSGFSSKKTMVRHIKQHPEDKSSSYQCQFCDHHFCHKSDFVIHTRTHKGTKPDCEKSYEQKDSLLFLRQVHTEEKPHQCYSDNVEADLHLRSVAQTRKTEEELGSRQDESGIKTFPLTLTPYDKSEFDQESLQPLCLYQIQTVADIDKDSAPLPLDHIKTEPDSPADDQRLLLVTPGERAGGETEPKHRNVKNVLARRPSGKSTELIVQFEAGTAQKPYKCPCCTKCFSLTKTLIRHVKIHTQDKSYQCQFCGRNFCQKSDLVNHTRIHTGERPYQCHDCHKSFAQKGNLVVHMRKHAGERLDQCQQSSLQCHTLNHT